MIAVVFEVWPAEGQREVYLELAARLASELAEADGFISVERFESITEPGKLLSLSMFRDEDAIAKWRNQQAHRATQAKGRRGVFKDYRLRIAQVVRDYGMDDRDQAPEDSQVIHAT